MYMYAQAATGGGRGIYLPAHGSGAAKSVFAVDTNNGVTFYGYLSGNISGSSTSCSGNAATATRINGNLSSVSDNVSRNIWISSTSDGDGIPRIASGFFYNPSTKLLSVASGGRVSGNGGHLYLGNSDNNGWVYIQDAAAAAGSNKWKIYSSSGEATFTKCHGAVWNDYAEMRNVPEA